MSRSPLDKLIMQSCTRKKQYKQISRAYRVIEQLKKLKYTKRKKYTVYQCRFCKYYHLTTATDVQSRFIGKLLDSIIAKPLVKTREDSA